MKTGVWPYWGPLIILPYPSFGLIAGLRLWCLIGEYDEMAPFSQTVSDLDLYASHHQQWMMEYRKKVTLRSVHAVETFA